MSPALLSLSKMRQNSTGSVPNEANGPVDFSDIFKRTSMRLRCISEFIISFGNITALIQRQPWVLAWKKRRGR
jgi:hypothetical protein